MPVIRQPIISAVLAHRRDNQAVGQTQAADLEWLKKLWLRRHSLETIAELKETAQ